MLAAMEFLFKQQEEAAGLGLLQVGAWVRAAG